MEFTLDQFKNELLKNIIVVIVIVIVIVVRWSHVVG